MGLITADDYIYSALRRCGQLRPGAKSSTDLRNDALTEWGLLFDDWAAERDLGFSIPTYQYTVNGPGSQTNGQGYLVGPTAHAAGNANDFQGPRPESIIRANCVLNNVGSQPVYLPMRSLTPEEWASLAIQKIPAINVTNLFWYNPTFPNGTLNIFPPLVGNAIQLYCWAALAAPATLGASYSAPPVYASAVIYSLAERLWPMCTLSIMVNKVSHQWLAAQAHMARETIRRVNRSIPTLRSDFRGGGSNYEGFYDPMCSWSGQPY